MPRKRKPTPDGQTFDLTRIVDLGRVRDDAYGRTWAELFLPGIPPSQVAEVAQAVALAVTGVLKWPDDQAAIYAERVRVDIAEKLERSMTPGPPLTAEDMAASKRELDDAPDGLPF